MENVHSIISIDNLEYAKSKMRCSDHYQHNYNCHCLIWNKNWIYWL